MYLIKEIQKWFATQNIDSAYNIESIEPKYPAWVIRFCDSFGVAIPYEGKDINEKFANVALYSDSLNLGDISFKCLFLTSSVEKSRNEFAAFCKYFVDPQDSGIARKALKENPVDWWNRWKILIGNSIFNKKSYAVIGELIMYQYLLKMGYENVSWQGPNAASHDLIYKDCEYEVKSTLSRYDKIIHVAGEFQMQKSTNKLSLFFCRFEENVNGICIDDCVYNLNKYYGIDQNELNDKLITLGYEIGNSARQEKYQIHEIVEYLVDDNFPRITLESFHNNSLPYGITHISYDIDLSVVQGRSIPVNYLNNY